MKKYKIFYHLSSEKNKTLKTKYCCISENSKTHLFLLPFFKHNKKVISENVV